MILLDSPIRVLPLCQAQGGENVKRVRMTIAASCLVILGLGFTPDDPDPIDAALKSARDAHDAAIEGARDNLLAEFDKWIDAAKTAGKLEVVEELDEQKKNFQANEQLPTAKQLQTGKTRFMQSLASAKRGLITQLKKAESDYTKADRLDEAKEVREERQGIEQALPLAAGAGKKPMPDPATFLQPGSLWGGRSVTMSRGSDGKPLKEGRNIELLVTSRDGDRFSFKFTSRNPNGRDDAIQEHRAVLGQVARIGKNSVRLFTWGEGAGNRVARLSSNRIEYEGTSGDGRAMFNGWLDLKGNQ